MIFAQFSPSPRFWVFLSDFGQKRTCIFCDADCQDENVDTSGQFEPFYCVRFWFLTYLLTD